LSSLAAGLKAVDGIETLFLTTNGVLLGEQLPALAAAGLDGVNISLDAMDEDVFRKVTRREGVDRVLRAIDGALEYPGLTVKLNCVPTAENLTQIIPMAARFLQDERLSLRFIELMPIGLGRSRAGVPEKPLRVLLETAFGELTPLPQLPADGPCRYYRLGGLPGKIGFISAASSCFCPGCNRVRLSSVGFLKTCLQFDQGADLKPLLMEDDAVLLAVIRAAIWNKPERHRFDEAGVAHAEKRIMSQIGG
jgi:cyclic pyranopterin phosphate synthase